MSKLYCWLKGIYLTIRFPSDGLFVGTYIQGHAFEPTGETTDDGWVLQCPNCGYYAVSEVRV